jgi:hypothetical protein
MLNNTILAGQGLTKEVCSEMHSYGTLLIICKLLMWFSKVSCRLRIEKDCVAANVYASHMARAFSGDPSCVEFVVF